MIAAAMVIGLCATLAFANGANDVSKGIATLVGGGVTNYRRAILWGTVWTAAGAVVASVAAGVMLATFGSGLLASGVTPSLAAVIAALAGAGAWVIVATRTGMPVSTTHALIGAVVGSASSAYGASGIAWTTVATKIALPLIASPIVAFVLARLLSNQLTRVFSEATCAADCVCVTAESVAVQSNVGDVATLARVNTPSIAMSLTTGDMVSCEAAPARVRVSGDHLHWLSSGAASFARGMNDTPKIVGLALGAAGLSGGYALSTSTAFGVVAVAIVAGSLFAGLRVTRVLAEDVTPMNHREGLSANLVTATLVAAGAVYGWPMSTTHVSSAGIVGIGAARGSLNLKTVRHIGLAWIVTLPAAALLGAAAFWLARAWL